MATTPCPNCATDVEVGEFCCPSCDMVMDISQVVRGAGDVADGDDEVAFLEETGEHAGELIDLEAGFDDGDTEHEPRPAQDEFDDELTGSKIAAVLAEALEDDTGEHAARGAPLDSMLEAPLPPPPVDGAAPYGGEARILGDVSPLPNPEYFDDFLSEQTGAFPNTAGVLDPAPAYVSDHVQRMVVPTAVLALKEGADAGAMALSPFERHVLQFIDGQRSVARITRKAGLSASDIVICIGLLADRGLLVVTGHLRPNAADAAPAEEPAARRTQREVSPFGDDLSFEGPAPVDDTAGFGETPAPLELPLDALQPLPVSPPPAAASAGDDDEVAVRPAASAVRPAAAAAPAEPKRRVPVIKDIEPAPSAAPPPPARGMKTIAATNSGPADPAAHARAMQVLDLALKDLRSGKPTRALAYVKMAAEMAPDDPKIQDILANWGKGPPPAEGEDERLAAEALRLESAKDFHGAANALRKAIKLKPSEPELYNRLGIVLALRLKDHAGAAQSLKKALELRPENLAYRANLGKIIKMAAGEKVKDETLLRGDESDKAAKAASEPAGKASLLDRLRGLRK